MQLEIACPNCGKTSRIDEKKVPKGDLKTTCNACQTTFMINKMRGSNCHRVTNKKRAENEFARSGWRAEHPACQGITYDLQDLGPLITSGLIVESTAILPPGESKKHNAGDLPQLRKFFDKYHDEEKKG
jgi:hypothetical protein